MKQHITTEQLEELNVIGMIRLDDWWEPNDIDLCQHVLYGVRVVGTIGQIPGEIPFDKGAAIPLLSIGQMIEFLAFYDLPKFSLFSFDGGNAMEWGEDKEFLSAHELCDKLWEAVKEVLNE